VNVAKKRTVRPELAFARLVLARGASELELTSRARELYDVKWQGKAPEVSETEGTVLVKQGRRLFGRSHLEIAICPALPWEIELRGGAHELRAALQDVTLRSFDIGGGAHEVELSLGRPSGACAVRIAGGVHELSLKRPHGVGLRVEVRGGASELSLDRFHFGSVGGVVRWESEDYRTSTDRYDVTIKGGASELAFGWLDADEHR
jgi:hypothetical protein